MLLIKLFPFLNDIIKFFKNIPDLISTSFNDISFLPENFQHILRSINHAIRYQDNEKFYQGLLVVIIVFILIYILIIFLRYRK